MRNTLALRTVPAAYVHLGDRAVHFLHTGATTLPGSVPALDRGQLFVFLHCAGGCAALWQRQLRGLGAEHSVVALDLPAHGRSSGVEGVATVEAGVELLTQFVDALRLRPFILVGHSFGATLALAFAARRAARLRGLVLAGVGPKPDLTNALATLRQVVMGRLPQQFSPEFFSPQTAPDLMREFFMAYVTTDPRVRLTDLEAAHGYDCLADCGGVTLPTLVIAGVDDRVAPPDHSAAVAQAIAGARFETIAAAGHAVAIEQADAFNTLLIQFAAGLA